MRGLSNRVALTSGGGWKNPYITDGLVAMWDGEWNYGKGGSHNGNASEWIDIITGTKFSTMSGSSSELSFGEKWLFIPSLTSAYVSSSNVAQRIKSALGSNTWTFQCVWRTIGSQTVDLCYMINQSFGTKNYIPFILNIGDYGNAGLADGKCFVTVNQVGWYNSDNRFIADSQLGDWGITYGSPSIRLEQLAWDRFTTNSAKFYAMRIYNRILTESEVSQNYALDRMRFNGI